MNWISGAVGLGGVGVALLTLLLTYSSRLSPYQQKLYERQLEAATDMLQRFGRYHDEALDLFGSSGPGPAADLNIKTRMEEVRRDFFQSYRRWNVVITQPVAKAVTAYLLILDRLSDAAREQRPSEGTHQDSPGKQLADAYAMVVDAAQRELHVKRLSKKTVRLIESLSRQSVDSGPSVDPLYIKAIAERPFFESFVDESIVGRAPAAGTTDRLDLLAARNRLYVEHRNLFLVHAWRPSTREGQLVDISIRVTEHERRGSWPKAEQPSADRPISDGLIEKVEYFLGPAFRRSFVKRDVSTGFRLDVSAYGPTLCIARVHFTDGKPPVTLHRYLDFVVSDGSAARADQKDGD